MLLLQVPVLLGILLVVAHANFTDPYQHAPQDQLTTSQSSVPALPDPCWFCNPATGTYQGFVPTNYQFMPQTYSCPTDVDMSEGVPALFIPKSSSAFVLQQAHSVCPVYPPEQHTDYNQHFYGVDEVDTEDFTPILPPSNHQAESTSAEMTYTNHIAPARTAASEFDPLPSSSAQGYSSTHTHQVLSHERCICPDCLGTNCIPDHVSSPVYPHPPGYIPPGDRVRSTHMYPYTKGYDINSVGVVVGKSFVMTPSKQTNHTPTKSSYRSILGKGPSRSTTKVAATGKSYNRPKTSGAPAKTSGKTSAPQSSRTSGKHRDHKVRENLGGWRCPECDSFMYRHRTICFECCPDDDQVRKDNEKFAQIKAARAKQAAHKRARAASGSTDGPQSSSASAKQPSQGTTSPNPKSRKARKESSSHFAALEDSDSEEHEAGEDRDSSPRASSRSPSAQRSRSPSPGDSSKSQASGRSASPARNSQASSRSESEEPRASRSSSRESGPRSRSPTPEPHEDAMSIDSPRSSAQSPARDASDQELDGSPVRESSDLESATAEETQEHHNAPTQVNSPTSSYPIDPVLSPDLETTYMYVEDIDMDPLTIHDCPHFGWKGTSPTDE